MSNAQAKNPAPHFKWDKQRRNDWEDVRSRQLHRAYVTPVVPGDWLNLVKTQEGVPWYTAPPALAPVPESRLEDDETKDVMAALESIGDRLKAQRRSTLLVPPSSRPQPPPQPQQQPQKQLQPGTARTYHRIGTVLQRRGRVRLDQHTKLSQQKTIFQSSQPAAVEKEKDPPGQPTLSLVGLTSNLHTPRRAAPVKDPQLPQEVQEAYSRPAGWFAEPSTDTPKPTPRPVNVKPPGINLPGQPMEAGAKKAYTGQVSRVVPAATTDPAVKFSLIGQKLTAPEQSDSVPSQNNINPKTGHKVKRLRPRSRTSMNSLAMSNSTFDDHHQRMQDANSSIITTGTRMLPDLDPSSPLVSRPQYTSGGDDGWETEPDTTILSTSEHRRSRRRRRKSAKQRSRRAARAEREKSDVSFVSTGFDDNAENLRDREQRRKMREYDSARATSALPPPDADEYLDDEPPPTSSRTIGGTASVELPDMSPSQATLGGSRLEDGFSQTGTASTALPTTLARASRPDSPGWEDEDLDRTTTSRGTNRDSFRNLDPVSKRRLDAKKSLLFKKLQANIVKKRYDKKH